MRVLPPIGLAAALMASCAPSTGPAGPEVAASSGAPETCFYTHQIRNFRAGNQTLYIRSQSGQVYEISGAGGCWDLNQASGIALTPFQGGQRLCVGDSATLAAGGGTCRVRVSRPLTDAEVQALPRGSRP